MRTFFNYSELRFFKNIQYTMRASLINMICIYDVLSLRKVHRILHMIAMVIVSGIVSYNTFVRRSKCVCHWQIH